MAADTPIPILVPIGQPLGMTFGRDADKRGANEQESAGQPQFRVRIGGAVARLTDDQFGAWLLAHGDVDRQPQQITSRALHIELQRSGVTEPDRPIASLLELGLLKEVPMDNVGQLLFARTHRMRPLMIGLGNSPDRVDRFALGFPNNPLVTMAWETYRLVTRAGMYRSLIEAVVDLADLTSTDVSQESESGKALPSLLADIHEFLSVNAIYFDRAAELSDATAGK